MTRLLAVLALVLLAPLGAAAIRDRIVSAPLRAWRRARDARRD
jgi:hypothetical protein